MTPRLGSVPVALRLPLLAGVAALLAALATGQLVLTGMGRQLDREVERLGRVYLDGLSAAVLPALAAGDTVAVEATLQHALGFQDGVRERRLIVFGPAGGVLAEAVIRPEPSWGPPLARGVRGAAWEISADGDAVWAQRPITDAGGREVALVAAKLDLSDMVQNRRGLEVALVFTAALLAGAGAGLTGLAVRRVLRPLLAVTRALDRAGAGDLAPLPASEAAPPATEAGRVALAFNGMVARLAERERLAARLAERERAVLLGRLVATVAHEVRNPLAGMLTAVETARTFGDDRTEREEALEVLERGLLQVEAVVSSALALHRDDGPPRPLVAADLEDLRALVGPAARQGGVGLEWRVELRGAIPTHAAQLRQAALNLLLNAIEATPPGGCVTLEARTAPDGGLMLAISDSGTGMPPEGRERLLGADRPPEDAPADLGLGLDIVRHLAGRIGAALAVEPGADGRGTRVLLRLPLPTQPLQA
jgi:two-component system, OmpR family, sensor kinase